MSTMTTTNAKAPFLGLLQTLFGVLAPVFAAPEPVRAKASFPLKSSSC